MYDLSQNTGWESVSTDHDTDSFVVAAIRSWWLSMGQPLYPDAKKLLIIPDCGGSHGSRARLWELELQGLADELNLSIQVCHVPPCTRKWNNIKHRMLSNISMDWRGRPLMRVSEEVIVNLIMAASNDLKLHTIIGLIPPPKKVSRSPTLHALPFKLSAMTSIDNGIMSSHPKISPCSFFINPK